MLRNRIRAVDTILCVSGAGGHPPGPAEPLAAVEDPLAVILDLRATHGDDVRFRNAHREAYLVSSPEGVRDVLHNTTFERTKVVSLALGDGLLASDGELWRAQRQLIGPLMRKESMPAFAAVMQQTIGDLVDRWAELADTGEELDVFADMTELSLRIVLRSLFGTDGGESVGELIAAVRTIVADLGVLSATVFGVPALISSARRKRFEAAMQTVDAFAAELIASPGSGPTLQRVLDDAPPELTRDEIVSMLVAGHETTSVMLAWTWHLLAEAPEAEARLGTHLAEVLGGEAPTVDRLDDLEYASAVLHESLRLYPPVWCMVRTATEDAEVAGYRIPADSMVALSAWSTHRDPSVWPDPERFDPDRFGADAVKRRHPYAYFPFGGGRHLCVGDQFALVEGMLLLAATAERFVVRPVPGHTAATELAITLRPRDGLIATIERREHR